MKTRTLTLLLIGAFVLSGCGTSEAEKREAEARQKLTLACSYYSEGDEKFLKSFRELAQLDVSYLDLSLAARDFYTFRMSLALYRTQLNSSFETLQKMRQESGLEPLSIEEWFRSNSPEIWEAGVAGEEKLDAIC
jgi:hypothetical protein